METGKNTTKTVRVSSEFDIWLERQSNVAMKSKQRLTGGQQSNDINAIKTSDTTHSVLASPPPGRHTLRVTQTMVSLALTCLFI